VQYQVLTITEGPAGSGKTFARVKDLVENVLVDEDGGIVTNLPFNMDVVPDVVERLSRGKVKASRVRKRITLLSRDETEAWLTDVEQGGTTPLTHFAGFKSPGTAVIIDEAHRYCGHDRSQTHVAEWLSWIGELRHDGMRCELITQARSKLHASLEREAGALITVVPIDELRDPFVKMPLKMWYQLEAAFFTGKYVPGCAVRLQTKDGKSWKIQPGTEKFHRLRGEVFEWYDSYAARQGGEGSIERPKELWEKLGRWGLLSRCLREYSDELVFRPAMYAAWISAAAYFMTPYLFPAWTKKPKPTPPGPEAYRPMP
jgi:hypothetical protein